MCDILIILVRPYTKAPPTLAHRSHSPLPEEDLRRLRTHGAAGVGVPVHLLLLGRRRIEWQHVTCPEGLVLKREPRFEQPAQRSRERVV